MTLPEYTQILYPDENDVYLPLIYTLRGTIGSSLLKSVSGLGKAPSHIITQRGPFQDGATPLDMRWDERTVDIDIFKTFYGRDTYWDKRWDFLDWLRPNRAFDLQRATRQPLILRHYLPGGKYERGHDLTLEAGSTTVVSPSARFVHWGLLAGERLTITGSAGDDGTYTVVAVPNDYSAVLDTAMSNDESGVTWQYRRAQSYRDLMLYLTEGPDFAEPSQVHPYGINDTLRFVAYDPFWYGAEQYQSWAITDALGDLVFDGEGAWLGSATGVGRWLFAPTYVGETVSLVYWGHVGALPIIELTGPATNPVISNTTLNVTLTLDYTIAAGEIVTIDTLNQTVENNAGTNLFAYLNGDMANFYISPSPQAPGRVNNISLTFSGGVGGVSEGRVIWRNRYVSL